MTTNVAAFHQDVWKRAWSHRPTASRDDLLLERERESTRWQHIMTRIHHAFQRIGGLKTIELGSGRGDLSALLARAGAQVTLLDRCTEAHREARWRFERLNLPFTALNGDLLNPRAVPKGEFDLAISTGVAEHFLGFQRTEVFRAHRAALRTGGMAIISVPHAQSLPYRFWKSYLEFRRRWPYGVEIPFSASELKRRMSFAGFARIEVLALNFWQAMGDQCLKGIFHIPLELRDRPSRLDSIMGVNLLAFGFNDVCIG